MAQKSDADLTTQAQVIRDETALLANTKTRVYNNLKDIIDSKVNNDAANVGTVTSVNGDSGPSVALVAANIPCTPAGNLSATDIQAALAELDGDITAGLDGLKWKSPSARLRTTGNITLSGEQTIDGFLTSTDDVLVMAQSTPSQNGVYTSAAGAWSRRADCDTGLELEGAVIGVLEGTVHANTTWRQVTDNITLGSSDVVWEVFGSSVPDADATTKGIGKLYATPDGNNADGSVTQAGLNSKFRAVRTVTGADDIVQTDDNALVIFNSASAFDFTLEQLTANSKASFINIGAGAVTFVNGTGVTLTGSSVLSGAIGTNYPSAVVFYHTATTPRILNSGPNDLALVTVSTASTPIDLDFSNEKERMWVGSASFAVPKTFTFSNDANALIFTLTLTITNVAGVVTFPSSVAMNTQDSRWNTSSQAWAVQSGAEGKYVFGGSWDGTTWNVAVEGPIG